jgi:8-oxo-dGTP pyrophosphatase MutT (NUDIX family)
MKDISIRWPEGHFNFCARAVILQDGKVLLVKDSLGRHYYPIGGRVQLHETAAQAAQREALEETGAAFAAQRLLFIHENFFGVAYEPGLGNHHELCLIYLMRHIGGELRTVTDGGETLEWLPVDRLNEYKIYPQFFPAELPRLTNEIKHFVTRE